MKLLRSWPSQVPEGRAYVVDDCPRMVMSQLDYRPPFTRDVDDDLLLIEWDIAIGPEELTTFAKAARRRPEEMLVAPYKIYPSLKYDLPAPIWAHRHWDGTADPPGSCFPRYEGWTPVETGDETCNLFGFGISYFPRDLVHDFLRTPANQLSDVSFGMWHYAHVSQTVAICWDAPGLHLNFEMSKVSV